MPMSYDEILRRCEEQMERSWRRWSTAMGLVMAAGVLVVAQGRATPFDPFIDLPLLFVATFWIVAAAATWAGWIGARVTTALRIRLLAFRSPGGDGPSSGPSRPAPRSPTGAPERRRSPDGVMARTLSAQSHILRDSTS